MDQLTGDYEYKYKNKWLSKWKRATFALIPVAQGEEAQLLKNGRVWAVINKHSNISISCMKRFEVEIQTITINTKLNFYLRTRSEDIMTAWRRVIIEVTVKCFPPQPLPPQPLPPPPLPPPPPPPPLPTSTPAPQPHIVIGTMDNNQHATSSSHVRSASQDPPPGNIITSSEPPRPVLGDSIPIYELSRHSSWSSSTSTGCAPNPSLMRSASDFSSDPHPGYESDPSLPPTITDPQRVPSLQQSDLAEGDVYLDENKFTLHTSMGLGNGKQSSGVFMGTYDGKSVAAKVYDDGSIPVDELKTIRFLVQNPHENIVTCFGVVKDKEIRNRHHLLFHAMPKPLHDIIHSQITTAPTLREILQYALDIAKGLEFLHKNLIVHRDIKPSNILVSEENRLCLADFGLSKVGATSTMVGTLRYCAPEILGMFLSQSRVVYTNKVDIYSFAMVCTEMLTRQLVYGDLPFGEGDKQESATKILAGLRPLLPNNNEHNMYKEFCKLITECWDNNPDARPDAASVVKAIEEILSTLDAA